MNRPEALIRWIRGLDADARAGQLIMVAPDPDDDPETAADWCLDSGYGGIFLQWRHMTDMDWLVAFMDRLREREDDAPPMFVATDEEGGLVSDLAMITGTAPSPAALGVIDDSMTTFQTALAMGDKLRALGFNLNFAPSLDVNVESKNPVIGTRSFGPTPQAVVKHGLATLEGYARAGLVSCVKHFPGHGSTRLDSHIALPVLDAPLEVLETRDLPPFKAAIDGGVQVVMTGHLACPALDPSGAPATLSPRILGGLLREELGFDGVIVSDDMEMSGVAALGDAGAVARNALEAGVDLLLYARSREMAAEVREALAHAIESGDIDEERILRSLGRVGRLREAIRATRTEIDAAAREEVVDHEHEDLLRTVAREAITHVGPVGPELPLPWTERKGLFIVPAAPTPRLNVDVDYLRTLLEPLGLALEVVGVRPTPEERQAAHQRAMRSDFLIAATLTRGSVVPEQRQLIDDLLGLKKQLTVVSLLDPHDLAEYPTVRTRLATRGFHRHALEGLLHVLTGQSAPHPEHL